MHSSASSIASSRILMPVLPMTSLMDQTKARFASMSPSEIRIKMASKKIELEKTEDERKDEQNTSITSSKSVLKQFFLERINEARNQSQTVMVPVKLFSDKQSELKTLVNECVKNRQPNEVAKLKDQLQKAHTEYNQDAEDLQKCLFFFEQQLLMFADDVDIDRPIPIPGELETFEQIKNRRAIHEKDD